MACDLRVTSFSLGEMKHAEVAVLRDGGGGGPLWTCVFISTSTTPNQPRSERSGVQGGGVFTLNESPQPSFLNFYLFIIIIYFGFNNP